MDELKDKREKFLQEEDYNHQDECQENEKAKIEMMKQHVQTNDNVVNYNIYNSVKVDKRTFNITSVGNQFVTNSYSPDEVFFHHGESSRWNRRHCLLFLNISLLIVAITFIIIFVIY